MAPLPWACIGLTVVAYGWVQWAEGRRYIKWGTFASYVFGLVTMFLLLVECNWGAKMAVDKALESTQEAK